MAFRILSLDGGGAWALIQVRTLIDLYGGETRGNEILAEYDLAACRSEYSCALECADGLQRRHPLAQDGCGRSVRGQPAVAYSSA